MKRLVERVAPGAVARWQRHKLERALASRRKTRAPASAEPLVLFFAPDAWVVPHFVSHLLVARTLKELGHRVLVVRCYRHLLPRCIAVEGAALPVSAPAADKARLCADCARHSLEMVDAYGLDIVDLEDIVDDGMRARLRGVMAALPEDLKAFSLGGVPVGQFANADLSRMLKINDPARGDAATREHVRQYIETAVLSYLAGERLCERFNVRRFVYFNDYAMTLAARAVAEHKGIPTTHLSHVGILNNDRRRVVMLTGYAPLEGVRRLKTWPTWRDLALPAERVRLVSEDSFLRFAGSGFTIYSPAWTSASETLFERLALDRSRRLLVAYTSSEDEIRAVRFYESALGVEIFPGGSVFADQFDWLEALSAHVEASDDLQLVIRVHPREAPNRRENRTSENLRELQRRFSGSYRHVRVVWPADPVSSYDLAEIADLALIALSSIGLELVRLGVPVLASLPHMAETPDGIFVAWDNTREGYFAALRRALAGPPEFAPIAAAFRWINARFIEYAVDLGDVIPANDYPGLPPFALPREARTVEDVIIRGRPLSDLNRERLGRAQRAESAAEEHEAISAHLRAFLHFLMLGSRPGADYRLVEGREEGPERAAGTAASCAAILRDRAVTFASVGGTVARYSPMAARMVRLGAQARAAAAPAEA
jgi:hypothetical protein